MNNAQKEKIIESAIELLSPIAHKYTPEEFAHYVVMGVDELEDGSCEIFCEKCIGKAVAESELRLKNGMKFSYRYYQLDSTSSHKNCDQCGVIIRSCVTADTQEVEHWEGDFADSEFSLLNMEPYTAYQLYGVFEFAHQCESDLYNRLVKVAKRFLYINKKQ